MVKQTGTLKQQAVEVLGAERVAGLLSAGVVEISRAYGRAYKAFRNSEAYALSLLQLYYVSGGR